MGALTCKGETNEKPDSGWSNFLYILEFHKSVGIFIIEEVY